MNVPMSLIRVHFFETDAMGVVHHSNYLRYFEQARVNWWREQGIDYRNVQERGFHFPVVESQLKYRRPARFEDLLEVKVSPRLERAAAIFEYEIRNSETKELLTTGSTTHVCVDKDLKVRRLPEDLISVIQKAVNERGEK